MTRHRFIANARLFGRGAEARARLAAALVEAWSLGTTNDRQRLMRLLRPACEAYMRDVLHMSAEGAAHDARLLWQALQAPDN